MRHRKSGVKLNRNSSHRDAMFRNMVTSLFKHDKIRTTDAKAKELRKWADSMVTLAKRGDLHARRQALSIIREKDVVHKLFEEVQERFGAVAGGYTRVTKLGLRAGDAASMSLVELVSEKKAKPAKKKKKADSAPAPKENVQATVEDEVKAEKAEDKAEAAEEKTEAVEKTAESAEPAAPEVADEAAPVEENEKETEEKKEE